MEISVVPLGLGKTSVGDYIAAVVKYLETANLPHELTDMGTLVQGAPGELLRVAAALHELPFQQGVQRFSAPKVSKIIPFLRILNKINLYHQP